MLNCKEYEKAKDTNDPAHFNISSHPKNITTKRGTRRKYIEVPTSVRNGVFSDTRDREKVLEAQKALEADRKDSETLMAAEYIKREISIK